MMWPVCELATKWGNLERHVLEMVVVQAYRDGVMSTGRVRQVLGMATRWEVDAFLKQRGAWLHYDAADLAADQSTHEQLRSEDKLPA